MKFGDFKEALKARAQLAKLQRELKKLRVSAEAQGGKVKLVMDGTGEVKEIEIDDELLDPKKKKVLKKALVHVYNKAREDLARMTSDKLRDLMSF